MRCPVVVLACAGLLAACTGLQPQPALEQKTFLLEAGPAANPPHPIADLIIEVDMPRARAGYDSDQMAYTRRAGEIEYFTRSRWADTPAHMLAPALAQALEASGAFRTVVRAPSPVSGNLRLDTELIRLQQDFSVHPSRVDIAVRALLIGRSPAGVLASAQFEEVEPAPSNDPYGGVIAANRALSRLVGRIAEFCAAQLPKP